MTSRTVPTRASIHIDAVQRLSIGKSERQVCLHRLYGPDGARRKGRCRVFDPSSRFRLFVLYSSFPSGPIRPLGCIALRALQDPHTFSLSSCCMIHRSREVLGLYFCDTLILSPSVWLQSAQLSVLAASVKSEVIDGQPSPRMRVLIRASRREVLTSSRCEMRSRC